MNPFQKLTTFDSIRQHLNETVQSVLRKCVDGEDVWEQLLEANYLLESLPLSTSEFGLAVVRLRNAHRYLVSDERGAAQYELRLLADGLRPRASS